MTTAIFGKVGVIVGSVLTALLNFYLQKAADQRRWEREDELQRQHWEREDRAGLRTERIGLYRGYIAQVHQARDALGFDEEEMRRMMYEIELLGSDEVAGQAVELFFSTVDVWQEGNVPPPKSKIDQAMTDLERSLLGFNRAVRAEIGIPEPPRRGGPPPREPGRDN